MTSTTEVRPDVIALIADTDVLDHDQSAAETAGDIARSFAGTRHHDGRPVTPAEAKVIAGATLAEVGCAVDISRAFAEALALRCDDGRRLLNLCERHWDRDARPDMTREEAMELMTPAEQSEADQILSRIRDTTGNSYLVQFRLLIAEVAPDAADAEAIASAIYSAAGAMAVNGY